MSELNQTIKALYQDNISNGEVELAKDNLLGFFKLLQEIEFILRTNTKFVIKTLDIVNKKIKKYYN